MRLSSKKKKNEALQIWKQPKCPSTDEWIKKMWCILYIQWNTT